MTAVNPPLWMQANTYQAAHDRMLIASTFAAPAATEITTYPWGSNGGTGGGILPSGTPSATNSMNVSILIATGATSSIRVSPGTCVAVADDVSIAGPSYYMGRNEGNLDITLAARDSSARRDHVIAAWRDATGGASDSDFSIVVIKGTSGQTGVNVPASNAYTRWISLASIDVPPTGSITVFQDRRIFIAAAGGLVLQRDANDAPFGRPGKLKYRMDTGDFSYYQHQGANPGWKRVINDDLYDANVQRYKLESVNHNALKRTNDTVYGISGIQTDAGGGNWTGTIQGTDVRTPDFKSVTGYVFVIMTATCYVGGQTANSTASAGASFQIRRSDNQNQVADFSQNRQILSPMQGANNAISLTWAGTVGGLPTSPRSAADVPMWAQMGFRVYNNSGGFAYFQDCNLTVIPVG